MRKDNKTCGRATGNGTERAAQTANALDAKRPYHSPRLEVFGSVAQLTLSGATGSAEMVGSTMAMATMSDRATKTNIARIGTLPLGIGLYLYEYKPEFCRAWGHGRRLGVMADEVEQAMPEAVTVDADGYKRVNHAMLGLRTGRA